MNTSLTLLGIVLLAWLLVNVSRRWERNAPPGPLQLLGTLRLEGKRAVYLVRIGERVVALGASEGSMVKIGELALDQVGQGAADPGRFAQVLERLRGQSGRNAVPSSGEVHGSDSLTARDPHGPTAGGHS